MEYSDNNLRQLFVGVEQSVPLLDGRERTYVNFDNAATTPPFKSVVESIDSMLPYYAGVHRGTGFKSMLSTEVFDCCRSVVSDFLGADPRDHVVIFVRNTTDAVNKLAHHIQLQPDERVLTTIIEHHSNLLPWSILQKVEYLITTDEFGIPDFTHMEEILLKHKGKVKLVAVCGASNVTGCIPPHTYIAGMAHKYDAFFFIDAAQLAAHRKIDMGPPGGKESIDFVAFSGHKLYAPFGAGALIGPRDFFKRLHPDVVGGGAVELVTLEDVTWASLPEKEEAGTPNLIGILAMARALQQLNEIGFDVITAHEEKIVNYALERLKTIPQVQIFGNPGPCPSGKRSAVIPIAVQGIPHSKLAAILGYEWGIGVRHGCFCAHPYIIRLLNITEQQLDEYRRHIRDGKHDQLPGFVRLSFALYNTIEEIDYLIHALEEIIAKGPRAVYEEDPSTGEFVPHDYRYDFKRYFPVSTNK